MRFLAVLTALVFSLPAAAETVEIGGMGVLVDIPDSWSERSTDDESQHFSSPEKTQEIRFFAVEGGGGLIAKLLTLEMKKEDSDNRLEGPEKGSANGRKYKRWTGSKPANGTTMTFSLARVKVPGMGTILVVLRSLGDADQGALNGILESMRESF